jgi:hypothetical protein
LNLTFDQQLSSVAFKYNLHRYFKGHVLGVNADISTGDLRVSELRNFGNIQAGCSCIVCIETKFI